MLKLHRTTIHNWRAVRFARLTTGRTMGIRIFRLVGQN
jgi:hypothetical protein